MANFLLLPSEIHEIIISQLDYASLVQLINTNHYFHNLITNKQKSEALFELEKHAPGSEAPDYYTKRLIQHSALPCYKCMRGCCPDLHFRPYDCSGKYGLGQRKAMNRKCRSCVFRRVLRNLTASELYCSEGLVWIDCVGCKNTKKYLQLNAFHTMAWKEEKLCMECYWFQSPGKDGSMSGNEVGGLEKQMVPFGGSKLVLVRRLGNTTATALIAEIMRRCKDLKCPEIRTACNMIHEAACNQVDAEEEGGAG